MNTQLAFHETKLDPITRDNQVWLRQQQIAVALEYKRPDVINQVFNKHADEFTPAMTRIIRIKTAGGMQDVRVFSLRGCHLLAMFARTPVAKEFRRWVLDILDKEAGNTPAVSLTHQEVEALSGLLGMLPTFTQLLKKTETILRECESPLASQMHDAWAEPFFSYTLLRDVKNRCDAIPNAPIRVQ